MRCGLVCIGHKPAEAGLPVPDFFLSSKRLGVANEFVADDTRLINGVSASVLSEYSQLFMLNENRHLIANFDYLYLYQYRKFLSKIKGTKRSINRPYVSIVCHNNIEKYLTIDLFNKNYTKQIIGRPISMQQTLIEFYEKYHVASDLTNFSDILIEQSILPAPQCAKMLARTVMIPAPALGLFEKSKLFDVLDRLQAAWNAFAARHYIAREGFQRRVGGYLLERLHSELLMTALDERDPTIELGYQFVVSVDPIIKATQ